MARIQAPDSGGSIRVALDFLAPYMIANQTWPFDEITDVNAFQENVQTLSHVAAAYPDAGYHDTLAHLAANQSPLDLFRLALGYWPD